MMMKSRVGGKYHRMLRLKVKEAARAKGMSMHRLSLNSEVSYHVIRGIFKNPYKSINTDTINRIARALGVLVTEIIEDVPRDQVETKGS